MASRREVNVNRPEHSWIPFYRELAEKLADPVENWRGRQGELVGVMKRNERRKASPMPSFVDRLINLTSTAFTLCSHRSLAGSRSNPHRKL